MPLLPMSPPVFSILSSLVADRAGLFFDAANAAVFADKVAARASEAGFESLLDYYYFLRYDDAGTKELDALIEALVVGETYLFRELAPLETMVANFIVPAVECGRRPRIWCAACATGEEPHTVAILLASRGLLRQVDLVASDLSAAALARARAGRFTRRSLRYELPDFAARFLTARDGCVEARAELTEAIDWRQINLIDDAAVAALETFDVILCRNVLIYFNERTTRQVIDRLSARLRVGGALFVGISESLLRFGTPLACEESGGVFLYRKVA
jgi:chemotaxis protein methyltransferase CheR